VQRASHGRVVLCVGVGGEENEFGHLLCRW
jgi:hypothetical protein